MGKNILSREASIRKSIEEINMIIVIDVISISYRQDRSSRKYNEREG